MTFLETLQWEVKAWRELAEANGLLKNKAFKYLNPMEYALAHGKLYDPAPLTAYEQGVVCRAARIARNWPCNFAPKECFTNSQALVISARGALKYVEGYFASVIPTHHAWATINGKVVDLTLRFGKHPLGGIDKGPQPVKIIPALYKEKLADRIFGVWYESGAYMGVEFDRLDVIRHIESDETTASLLETEGRLTGKVV